MEHIDLRCLLWWCIEYRILYPDCLSKLCSACKYWGSSRFHGSRQYCLKPSWVAVCQGRFVCFLYSGAFLIGKIYYYVYFSTQSQKMFYNFSKRILTSTCIHKSYLKQISAIRWMGSKAPKTVVPPVALTKNGFLPSCRAFSIWSSRSSGIIFPLQNEGICENVFSKFRDYFLNSFLFLVWQKLLKITWNLSMQIWGIVPENC